MLIGERSALRSRRRCNQALSFHLNWRVSQTMAAFLGGTSKKNPQGSGLERDAAVRVANFKFVMRADADAPE